MRELARERDMVKTTNEGNNLRKRDTDRYSDIDRERTTPAQGGELTSERGTT